MMLETTVAVHAQDCLFSIQQISGPFREDVSIVLHSCLENLNFMDTIAFQAQL